MSAIGTKRTSNLLGECPLLEIKRTWIKCCSTSNIRAIHAQNYNTK